MSFDHRLDMALEIIAKEKPELLCIVGATASGKSDLAIEIAKNIGNADIINADSYSLYKKMNIGTAKVSEGERHTLYEQYNIKHYLIDILEPSDNSTVAQYATMARSQIAKCQARGRLPILCGGSGLYVRAVTDGFEFEGGLNPRGVDTAASAVKGQSAEGVASASKVSLDAGEASNDRHRGTKLPEYIYANPHTLQIGLSVPRTELDERIKLRTATMRERGLEHEVRALWEAGMLGITARKAIGYAEFISYFEGGVNPANGKPLTVDDVYDLIAMHTRRLVRRQESWFKRDPRICWV